MYVCVCVCLSACFSNSIKIFILNSQQICFMFFFMVHINVPRPSLLNWIDVADDKECQRTLEDLENIDSETDRHGIICEWLR